jgi:hypothetical protein
MLHAGLLMMGKLTTRVDDDNDYNTSLWDLKMTVTSLKCDPIWVTNTLFDMLLDP